MGHKYLEPLQRGATGKQGGGQRTTATRAAGGEVGDFITRYPGCLMPP